MRLSIYDIIQGPVISEKAQKINSDLKKLVLKVHTKSNKPLIKEAIEKLFNVKVDKVRVLLRKGKLRKFKRMSFTGKLEKRAIVTLKEGYTLDLFGHGRSGQAEVAENPQVAENK